MTRPMFLFDQATIGGKIDLPNDARAFSFKGATIGEMDVSDVAITLDYLDGARFKSFSFNDKTLFYSASGEIIPHNEIKLEELGGGYFEVSLA